MTDMLKGDEVVLKTDQGGRVRMPAVQREKLLDEFERSGVSGPQFAAVVGVKYQTLAGWARKRRHRGEAKGIAAVPPVAARRWLEATAAESLASGGLVLHVPGGVRMEVADEKQAVLAAVVVRALAKPC
jgi:hypothetical protein